MEEAEVARRSAQHMWGADAASRALGMRLVEATPGAAVVSMTVRADMVNGWGVCHGGLVATLADSCFAVACNTRGLGVSSRSRPSRASSCGVPRTAEEGGDAPASTTDDDAARGPQGGAQQAMERGDTPEVTVAAGFDITFLESAHLGDELVAEGREVAARGRSGVYDVTVRRGDGTVVAVFRGRSRSLGRPHPAVTES